MSKNIWVFCEQRDGELQSVALELLGVARELAAKTGEKVGALLLGHNVAGRAGELIAHGADEVYLVDDAQLAFYTTEAYAQAVHQIVKEGDPNVLMFGATSIGRDLAPRLSARLHTGLTADCTKLEMDEEGNLFMTRPAFGGNLMATIICPDSRPQMSTVRPGVMQKMEPDAARGGEIIPVTVNWDTAKFAVKVVYGIKINRNDNRQRAGITNFIIVLVNVVTTAWLLLGRGQLGCFVTLFVRVLNGWNRRAALIFQSVLR